MRHAAPVWGLDDGYRLLDFGVLPSPAADGLLHTVAPFDGVGCGGLGARLHLVTTLANERLKTIPNGHGKFGGKGLKTYVA
jgi:hypothetical protein